MNKRLAIPDASARIHQQRGMVLFFALIALVVMSLAAVALIRSSDTSTLIAGNLAYRQSAVISGDAGVEAALAWLESEQNAMTAAGKKVMEDATHTFNLSNTANAAKGYYSSVRPIQELTDGTVRWDATDSGLAGTDSSGNTVRYIIERLCRTPNIIPTQADCLFTTTPLTINDQKVLQADEACQGVGCLGSAQSTQLRITARITGPRSTVSYIQSFVY